MIDIAAWKTRLAAHCPLLEGRAYGSVELEAFYSQDMKTLPAAFVIFSSRKAEKNTSGKRDVRQRITPVITVVSFVGNTQTDNPGGQYGQQQVLDEIDAALLNWDPDGNGVRNITLGEIGGLVGGEDKVPGALRWDQQYEYGGHEVVRRNLSP